MAAAFPACGGDGSPAKVKVLLRYELISGRLEPQRLWAGKSADQGLAQEVVQPLQKNELQISDKGFFSSAAWRLAAARAAFLLCPLPRSIHLWLGRGRRRGNPAGPGGGASAQSARDCRMARGAAGPGTNPLRAGARGGLPPERGQRGAPAGGLHTAARKQGRTPTAATLQLADWRILVTNAPAAQ